jgi:hypothetical protein
MDTLGTSYSICKCQEQSQAITSGKLLLAVASTGIISLYSFATDRLGDAALNITSTVVAGGDLPFRRHDGLCNISAIAEVDVLS